MSFEWPLMLLALLVLPLVVGGYFLLQRRPARYAVAFTNLSVLAEVIDRPSAWRRYLPTALFLAALGLLCVALARPEVTVMVKRDNATVVLTVDASGSMLAEDVAPTRLGAARVAVERFLDRAPERFRIGMVMFAAEPQVVTPPTRDRDLVRSSLEFFLPLRGTAIGDAVARSAQLGRQAVGGPDPDTSGRLDDAGREQPEEAPVAVLFLSDGSQTAGYLSPLEGARRAKRLGVPIYTIALGTPEGVLELGFGPYRRVIAVPPDPDTLRAIADETGGDFFDAPSAEALTAAYDELGERLSHEPGKLEATFAFVAAGAAFALAAGVLSRLWFSRLP
jgi:Ca-activated chloride channel family protein